MSTAKEPAAKRHKRGDARREALVQAAAERFWTRGYAGSSIAQVAAAAGVPLGNVYYYHKTKADLAMAVADLFVGQTEALIDEVSAESDDPRGRLKALVGRLRASQAPRLAHGCPIAAACRDFRDEAPEAARRAAESFSILTGFIAAELGRTGMRPALALARARAIVCDWQGGIALGHALGEPPVLAEAFLRMERLATQP
ncbi:TetR/AcrR family transcriptional regulator [Oceaniradius stylonematis]|uniref:TetR/AcrR family transcriptional regulator n=1 Tax=Oceaniradius stylonematis TaxID=2184161 RepID=A0A3A8AII5_9HYPH|nr:TetR/AcrR family transcriptional regulator [Oceaniradius stylonematis]RKF07490.1 TetR/AcrR family transcriptional regulator [Oceaniradius stylonematis]